MGLVFVLRVKKKFNKGYKWASVNCPLCYVKVGK